MSRRSLHRKLFYQCLLAGLLVTTVWQWGHASWIYAKATLAQHLIEDAWQSTLKTPSANHKPWGWADTWPVARLQAPKQNEDILVLNGDYGAALAFGPGMNTLSAEPGKGMTLIAGHRDTHFRFLQNVQTNDSLRLQSRQGDWLTYRVSRTEVFDSRQAWRVDLSQPHLVLITCYPFDDVRSGPLRYLVFAEISEPSDLDPDKPNNTQLRENTQVIDNRTINQTHHSLLANRMPSQKGKLAF